MKKTTKITLILIIILTIVCGTNYCYAEQKIADSGGGGTSSVTDAISDGNDFLNNGKKQVGTIDSSLKNDADVIYNILLAFGTAIAVIIGGLLGIKFMIASVEDKAKIKEALIPYVIGCVVVFGAFGIWKLVVEVLNNIS